METIYIEPGFEHWRERARELLQARRAPHTLIWESNDLQMGSLFQDAGQPELAPKEAGRELTVPRDFLSLARLVACHRDPKRWAVLYSVLWRLTWGNERHALELHTDPDVRQLHDWSKAVRRDRHKMKAFVRFRKVEAGRDREQFVAWFEPEHDIVDLTAPFFAKRFANMDWSILTPWKCVHWKNGQLQFTPGVSRQEAPDEDALEEYWRTYYANIFNPARLKLDAMRAEMPKKYWKNLPEASLIAELTSKASLRSGDMIGQTVRDRSHVSERIPAGVPAPEPQPVDLNPAEVLRQAGELSLDDLRGLALQCRACPLHERGTQTVFGVGPPDAEIMIVGEQPGDIEDLRGQPFTGPAGQLLDRALATVGIVRERAYLTNVVKHFKWERRGKRRIHQKPSKDEVFICRPWVLAEILKIRPRVLICLGATAAQALIRADFALKEERGKVYNCDLAECVIATVHPSYLLRIPDDEVRREEEAAWLADLRLASRIDG